MIAFIGFLALILLMILRIIAIIINPIPNAIVTINIVFNLPTRGSFVILEIGLIHTGLIISSNPKTEPNMNPNNVEKIPATDIMPARLICFTLYNTNPRIASIRP